MLERGIPAESTHNDFVQAPLLLLIITDNKGFQAEQRVFFLIPKTSFSLSCHLPLPFSLISQHLLYIAFLLLSLASQIIDSCALPADAKKRTTRWFDIHLL